MTLLTSKQIALKVGLSDTTVKKKLKEHCINPVKKLVKNKIFGGLDTQRIATNFYDETTALTVFGAINE